MIFKLLKMIQSITLTLLVAVSLSINLELPKLIKTQYKIHSLPPLNVTIGEKFSLPLPHFDTPWQSKHFSVYQIPQQEFNKFTPVKSQEDNQAVLTIANQKQIDIDYLPFTCTLNPAKISIREELKSVREEYSHSRNTAWQENQYIHLSFRSLVYILKAGSSELIAYLYNDRTIDRLTTYKINQFVHREENLGDLIKSPPVIALNTLEDSMFLFTSLGIWEIKTKTVLTHVRKIENISGFNSKDHDGVDKVLHGENGIMVGLKRLNKIFILPEETGKGGGQFKEITSFKQMKEFLPQDIQLISNTLYVLDYKKGVYVYTMLANGSYSERTFIPFQSFGGNYMFTVYQSSIFINFNDIDGSKIIEISYDLENEVHYLVRYIKTDDYICDIAVFNAVTSYEGKPARDKYNEQSFDTFLFILLNFDDLQVYPFNLDPRVIAQPYNAVKLKGSDIRKVFHIKLDRFIIITNELIKYVRITIEKPAVVCHTKRMPSSSPSKYFKLAVTSNISSCEHKNHNLPQKRLFYQFCELQTNYLVHIADPEETEFQRFMLFGVVVGVIVLFVGGLVCLMQWRKNKMMILGRLKDEIVRFRNRHKRMQPFTEENMEHKEIEIEMPVVQVVAEDE